MSKPVLEKDLFAILDSQNKKIESLEKRLRTGNFTLAADSVENNHLASGSVGSSELAVIPAVRVHRNGTGLTIPNNTVTAVPFTHESWDTQNLHSTSTNTTRLTAPIAGIYTMYASWGVGTAASGQVQIGIRKQNVFHAALDGVTLNSVNNSRGVISTDYTMQAGEYIELTVWQSSGANLTFFSTLHFEGDFGMTWVGRTS